MTSPWPETGTCFVSLPVAENSSTAFGGTDILKYPFSSAETPVLAPTTFTETKGTGSPLSSVTRPVTIRF
jgi:hypothetical protein